MVLSHMIDELESMEPELRTIDRLLAKGELTTGLGMIEGGDFRQTLWSHSWDGMFSVGCIERVRHNGEAFPMHTHNMRQWIMCCTGALLLHFEGLPARRLKEGDYLVIEPNTPHEIEPLSECCVAVFTTIPADEGYCNGPNEGD